MESAISKMRSAQLEKLEEAEKELALIAVVEKEAKDLLASIKTKDQLEDCLSYLIDYFTGQGMSMAALEDAGIDWQNFQKKMKEKAAKKDDTGKDEELQRGNSDTPKPNGQDMTMPGPDGLKDKVARAMDGKSATVSSP